MAVDFKPVAEAALAMAAVLLPQWLGGMRKGHEWVGARKANGGPGDSWSVNLNTGAWGAFASDQAGGDLVSLYAALNHINQGAALEQVAQLVGVTDRHVPTLPRTAIPSAEHPAEPIPIDASPIPARGGRPPTAVYRYGAAFAVARYDSPSGKDFAQWSWRNGRWSPKGHSVPRPLYNLADLAKHPDAPVMIVEGEKCAETLIPALRRYVVITWAGGANSVEKNDWSPLAGREVVIWPDADDPGRQAAAKIGEILSSVAQRVRIINPTDHSDGWDAADAIAEGWDAARIAEWATAHIRVVEPTTEKPKTNGAQTSIPVQELAHDADYLPAEDDEEESEFPFGTAPRSALTSWQDMGLSANSNKIPYITLSNASLIIQRHSAFKAKIWFDTFRRRVYHTLNGSTQEWADADLRRVTAFVQQHLQLSKFTPGLIQEGVQHAADRNARNPLQEWLDSLEWDHVGRLDHWLCDTLGVEGGEYTTAVGRNWLISMVARAYRPGCKADHMPILEGKMGRGKSSFLEILGGEWYEAITTEIGGKAFLEDIQGVWLVEIPDMSGFGRREYGQIIAAITVSRDRYRVSYGRNSESHLRSCIFAATSEKDNYLKDLRGSRRFWPLRCTEINLDTLRSQRENLFAEAVHAYKMGASWHEMPAQAEREQLDRAEDDPWTQRVLAYAEDAQSRSGSRANLFVTDVLRDVLKIELGDQSQVEKNRVANILQAADWLPGKIKGDRCWFKLARLSRLTE